MDLFKSHPFAVEAFFDSSLVLTFAFERELIQHLVPSCLTLDTFQDKWAFIAVAMVRTSGLRPKGFPSFLGNDFFLIGYRIFVCYTTKSGKSLRGLYIIKSETDKKQMEVLGNLFTHYNYTLTDISDLEAAGVRTIKSKKSNFEVELDCFDTKCGLPEGSVFSNWKDARRFAGPLPYTFSYDEGKNEVVIVEGVRQNWKPRPSHINKYIFSFIDELNLANPLLVSAFEVRNVFYYWKKGKTEKWR